MDSFARRHGLTLIEMLVVIAVVGLLASLLIPAVQGARESARRAQCLNNLRQIGIALQQHAETHGMYPSGQNMMMGPVRASYLVPLLPYLEQGGLFNAINFDFVPPTGVAFKDPNDTIYEANLSVLLCPSDADWRSLGPWELICYMKPTNYAANAGNAGSSGDGVFISQALAPRDLTDGLSQTVGVAEWIIGKGSEYTINEGRHLRGDRLGQGDCTVNYSPNSTL